jgi:hypothetical protein
LIAPRYRVRRPQRTGSLGLVGTDPFRDETATLREKVLALEDRIVALEHEVRGHGVPTGGRAVPAARTMRVAAGVVGTMFVLGAFGGFLFVRKAATDAGPASAASTTDVSGAESIAGLPRAVDAVAAIPVVRAAAGLDDTWTLSSLWILRTAPDGVVDLDPPGYENRVFYTFDQRAVRDVR